MNTVLKLQPESDIFNANKEEIIEQIKRIKEVEGIPFSEIAEQIGVSRSLVSQFVNHGKTSDELEKKLRSFLTGYYKASEAVEYSQEIQLFPTTEFKGILGFCEDMRMRRKMGVIIGYPGTGKTTAVKEYVERTPGAVYIEAFSSMRMKDLLEIMAEECGIELKRGSNYKRIQQLIRALKNKKLMFIIDEAEYLKKWDVDKFEILRKIWDNTKVPIILCGTHELEDILTRGNGKDNLAQLYRRKYMMKLIGIKEKEVRSLLKQYKVTKEAENLLVALAIDVKHGGLGNFIEILELCLESAEDGEITRDIVKDAKNYKLLY
ncbi:AAA family ATPase [Maledivibacter halophilus]|uniref:DNA transposition protein, AAA+ family ATPase n=1 Tax=Maledivibacter halophilus TaxID=36842 RepID=A0A1T5LWE4_9FIRM|nr:AAA family ATPase [Maledivibacter halophilus]SKC68546.1 DNA transposition protein, AAA+ family ATPase [Maledivibacter halophilus]SKC71591.1 DNA transposition protein, AAA+ family ATPase [Maledivibacter halophilus]SKC80262.1 DNA transposition protein, AAA+ family ATPase [Maledivibacter halophilus]